MWAAMKKKPITAGCLCVALFMIGVCLTYSIKLNHKCINSKDLVCTRQVIDEDTLQCRVTCNDISPSKRPAFGSDMSCNSNYCVIYDSAHPGLFKLVPDTNGAATVMMMIELMFIAIVFSAIKQLREVDEKLHEMGNTV